MMSTRQNSGQARPARPPGTALFALAAFFSAGLVFLVEPMIAKLILPLQGGSPAVWNTSLAFFQVALLIGYGYAHGLQRLASTRVQALIHGGVLIAGALTLPLRVSTLLGEPSTAHPLLWLLGVLTVSIGPPFVALSATAPLTQVWFARAFGPAAQPYRLYAASNLGSLLALLAYPTLVEPLVRLHLQTLSWSIGYGLFFCMIMAVGWSVGRSGGRNHAPPRAAAPATRLAAVAMWWRRLLWVLLAAAPSSLMLGVTTYLATDIVSAPFLWIIPLALYLLSFIIAFQVEPAIPPGLALTLQGFALVTAVVTWGMPIRWFGLQAALHLSAFFLTALVCHQGLAARRPAPARLTEFYLLVSLGGVIGGAFNAFLAPVLFSSVIEYPAVLLAVALARPWGQGRLSLRELILLGVGGAGLASALMVDRLWGAGLVMQLAFGAGMICAFLLRDRAPAYLALCVALLLAAQAVAPPQHILLTERSFFGVVRISETNVKGVGQAKLMAHGDTLHGAQFPNTVYRCRPMVYYAPTTPIGQVFRAFEDQRPALNIGAVGMGAGTVAAYVRPSDRLRFFEIDPLVVRLATDPANFSYIHGCAQGPVDWVLGDARLTLGHEVAGQFDILLVDAFSSDSVPAHLLTVEAMRSYLARIKPDGIVIMHLSNRNLDLTSPVAAVAKAAGGLALRQFYRPPPGAPELYDSAEDAMIIAKDPRVLMAFETDPRWRVPQTHAAAPWTDDYTNLMGALIHGAGHNAAETKQAVIDAARPPILAPSPLSASSPLGETGGAVDQGED